MAGWQGSSPLRGSEHDTAATVVAFGWQANGYPYDAQCEDERETIRIGFYDGDEWAAVVAPLDPASTRGVLVRTGRTSNRTVPLVAIRSDMDEGQRTRLVMHEITHWLALCSGETIAGDRGHNGPWWAQLGTL